MPCPNPTATSLCCMALAGGGVRQGPDSGEELLCKLCRVVLRHRQRPIGLPTCYYDQGFKCVRTHTHTAPPTPSTVHICLAPACTFVDLQQRYRVCESHLKMLSLMVDGKPSRFCQQCGRFHELHEFDGNKRWVSNTPRNAWHGGFAQVSPSQRAREVTRALLQVASPGFSADREPCPSLLLPPTVCTCACMDHDFHRSCRARLAQHNARRRKRHPFGRSDTFGEQLTTKKGRAPKSESSDEASGRTSLDMGSGDHKAHGKVRSCPLHAWGIWVSCNTPSGMNRTDTPFLA